MTQKQYFLATVTIGIITIVVNVCIACYNVGKNRAIYDVRLESFVENNKPQEKALSDLLSTGKYTILITEKMDLASGDKYTYHLGKIKK
jgi:hypothetical protein